MFQMSVQRKSHKINFQITLKTSLSGEKNVAIIIYNFQKIFFTKAEVARRLLFLLPLLTPGVSSTSVNCILLRLLSGEGEHTPHSTLLWSLLLDPRGEPGDLPLPGGGRRHPEPGPGVPGLPGRGVQGGAVAGGGQRHREQRHPPRHQHSQGVHQRG